MKSLLVSQRVVVDPVSGERRDALDQRWHAFLDRAGLLALPVPNHLPSARALLAAHSFSGVLLTGGNDLAAHGGDAPERDAVELFLLQHALDRGAPVLGVCRGMQLALEHFGVGQERVTGHVQRSQTIEIEGAPAEVNSFHHFGCRATAPELTVFARAADGVVKAVRHTQHALVGIMWHPERLESFRADDIALFQRTFGASAS